MSFIFLYLLLTPSNSLNRINDERQIIILISVKKIPRKTSILRTNIFRKFLTKKFQNPKLTPSKLENSEQKNILPEKTPKNAHNPKTLNLTTLQPQKPKYEIFLPFCFSKTYRFTHQKHRFCFSKR